MSAAWTQLESLVVNGVYPLERCLGSTDQSGVYLSHATRHAPSAVTLKLVPWNAATADELLARWRATIELSHPQLVRIFEAGDCELEGRRYLFARMEYAELTLADVLEQRALTDGEARSMLEQTLDVLDYLHSNGLVHAGLKPSNFLVFGNELKLASDTVRPAGGVGAATSPADDVRGLALSLCEALTRVPPSGFHGSDDITLPSGLPAEFAPVISRGLRRDARARPTIAQLQGWLRGESLDATPQPTRVPSPAPSPPSPRPAPSPPSPPSPSPSPSPDAAAASRLVIRVELPSEQPPDVLEAAEQGQWRWGALAIAALVLGALAWLGIRAMTRDAGPSPPTPPVAVAPEAPVDTPPAAVAPVPSEPAPPEPVAAEPAAIESTRPEPVPPPTPVVAPVETPVGEVLPTVSRNSLATITGTVRVAVRVTVDREGRVVAASFRDRGPSRYFAQRSLEAAQKWTFPPAASEAQRAMLVRFNFRRSGVTATSEPAS